MDTKKDPGIRIEQIILEGFSFRKIDCLDLSKIYNVNINISNVVNKTEDDQQGRLLTTVKISEKSGQAFELELTYGLYASVIKEAPNMPIDHFLDKNAPPILYQFARETILTVTQKAGIPLVIPPMNLRKEV